MLYYCCCCCYCCSRRPPLSLAVDTHSQTAIDATVAPLRLSETADVSPPSLLVAKSFAVHPYNRARGFFFFKFNYNFARLRAYLHRSKPHESYIMLCAKAKKKCNHKCFPLTLTVQLRLMMLGAYTKTIQHRAGTSGLLCITSRVQVTNPQHVLRPFTLPRNGGSLESYISF